MRTFDLKGITLSVTVAAVVSRRRNVAGVDSSYRSYRSENPRTRMPLSVLPPNSLCFGKFSWVSFLWEFSVEKVFPPSSFPWQRLHDAVPQIHCVNLIFMRSCCWQQCIKTRFFCIFVAFCVNCCMFLGVFGLLARAWWHALEIFRLSFLIYHQRLRCILFSSSDTFAWRHLEFGDGHNSSLLRCIFASRADVTQLHSRSVKQLCHLLKSHKSQRLLCPLAARGIYKKKLDIF